MGMVYEARHEKIGRRFALKFLHAELAMHPHILARFEREAQAAGALESENIAAVTDFGRTDEGTPYIVMEYLQGEDLSRLLARSGPLSVPRAVDIVLQACRGLEAAHASGIVHRDLKPENLFIARRGDGTDLVKVLDFGIAKLRTAGDSGSGTRTGMTLGTPFYMPPEQARGQRDVDHRADIYAFGVILYELLSGEKPIKGDSYNAIMYQILTQAPVRLETLRANLPTGLADVVHRAMAAEAVARFGTVADLVEALAPFAGQVRAPRLETASARTSTNPAETVMTPAEGLAPSLVEQAVTAPATSSDANPASDAERATPARRAWLIGALVVLVAGGSAAAVLGFPHKGSPTPSASTEATTSAVPTAAAATARGPGPVVPPPVSAEASPVRPPDSLTGPTASSAVPRAPSTRTPTQPAPRRSTKSPLASAPLTAAPKSQVDPYAP
jgi:serine/threonine-protein kinase